MTNGPMWVQTESVPLDRVPLFVRAGATLPMGETMQFVPEDSSGRLTVHAFPNSLGRIDSSMEDESGPIRFRGEIVSNHLQIEVSMDPGDRSIPEMKCQLPSIHEAIAAELAESKSSDSFSV